MSRIFRSKSLAHRDERLVAAWMLGSIFLMAAVWITANLEYTTGVTVASYVLAALVAFTLFLLTGLCWIAVAVATRSKL
jgi:NADH:ubiquinone oxidoreductase subunit 6 (subunit J)